MRDKIIKPFGTFCFALMIIFFSCQEAKNTTEQVIENVVEEVIEDVVDTLLTPVENVIEDSNDIDN